MANITQKYGSNIGLTITLASLANGSGRASTAVDNSTDNFISADIRVKVKTGSSGVLSSGLVEVYFIRSEDGTNYDDNFGGTDGTYTNLNARLLGIIDTTANSTTYQKVFDTQELGITLPKKWSIALVNRSGAALTSTGGDHEVKYTGKYYQSN